MLYRHSLLPSLTPELFRDPPSEYRGAPFWAFNDLLTEEELRRQIGIFDEMGLGGFHMHVRTGLKNTYLDDKYMDLVRACVDEAKKRGMLAYLYDEDRWPSGAAGGLVTKDERWRARCLLFTNRLHADSHSSNDSRSEGGRSGKGKVLACYDVRLDGDGRLTSYRRIGEEDEAEGEKWYALLEVHQPSSWYNDQTYVDTLNPDAIRRFTEVTHDAYKKAVGEEFDKTVPSIFTDEPQFTRKQVLKKSRADAGTDVTVPWTDGVPEGYLKAYGADIFETLPELFWERADLKPSLHRYRYHDYIAERFAESFADVVGGWCEKNGIALTGHMMEEPSLRSQTAALGEAMRSYRAFGIPGIDMLCNSHEFTTAKQAQSAARQFGREGVMSELYGVTGWDSDFRMYKHQGDWQAALGVTLRVPHLSWYAMRGEAKRDYPASISYQSPWYKEWGVVEDHFGRVNAALTRGKPVCRVGVIHPVESYWLHWGPEDLTRTAREDIDRRFKDLTNWLLRGGIDFDFISESLLPSLCERGGAPLQVGECAYDAVIVPQMETMRASTLTRLEAFRDAGGKLLFLGEAPTLLDAKESDLPGKLAERSERVSFERSAVLDALGDVRELRLTDEADRPVSDYLYQLREDGPVRWLFVVHADEPRDPFLDSRRRVRIHLKGQWRAELWDTGTGKVRPAPTAADGDESVFETALFACDSLLLRLFPGAPGEETACEKKEERVTGELDTIEGFSLDEENVLVLDQAFYALDDGAFSEKKEEVLRLDNLCRRKLGWRERGSAIVQPWVTGNETFEHRIRLRYTFESEAETDAVLALEEATDTRITLNGRPMPSTVTGYYVDIAVDRVPLPGIRKGTNVLELEAPFGRTRGVENCFVLGRFGVKLLGRDAVLTAYPEKLRFGDLTGQGFPFYGGNVVYRFRAQSTNGKLRLRFGRVMGTLSRLFVDGKDCGPVAYQPYVKEVSGLTDGLHDVELKVYLHRYNTFGALHDTDEGNPRHWPGAWRTKDEAWSYEYVLRRTGMLKAPEILEPTE